MEEQSLRITVVHQIRSVQRYLTITTNHFSTIAKGVQLAASATYTATATMAKRIILIITEVIIVATAVETIALQVENVCLTRNERRISLERITSRVCLRRRKVFLCQSLRELASLILDGILRVTCWKGSLECYLDSNKRYRRRNRLKGFD